MASRSELFAHGGRHLSTPGTLFARARALALRVVTDREARIVAVFSLLSIVGGFFGNRLLTQVAQPEALGKYYLYANLAQWLSMPAAAGFVYINHHWPIAREHGDTRRFSRAIAFAVALQAGIALAGAVTMHFSGTAGMEGAGPATGVGLLALGTGTYQLLCTLPGAERWRGWSGALSLLGGNARPFAQAFGILLLGTAASAGLLGAAVTLQLVAAGMAATLYVWIFRTTLSADPPRLTSQLSFRAFLTYSVPGFFGVLIPQIASSIERWGLARSSDTAATALFVQAMGMSVAVTGAISGIVVNYYYPFATNAAARDTADPLGAAAPILRQFYGVLVTALASVTVLIALFVKPITWIAFGARFASVARLLPWTIVGASLFALGAALTAALFIARDAMWPNLARIISQLAYVAALLLLPRGSDPAGTFAREYAGAQALYTLLIAGAIWRQLVARRLNGNGAVAS